MTPEPILEQKSVTKAEILGNEEKLKQAYNDLRAEVNDQAVHRILEKKGTDKRIVEEQTSSDLAVLKDEVKITKDEVEEEIVRRAFTNNEKSFQEQFSGLFNKSKEKPTWQTIDKFLLNFINGKIPGLNLQPDDLQTLRDDLPIIDGMTDEGKIFAYGKEGTSHDVAFDDFDVISDGKGFKFIYKVYVDIEDSTILKQLEIPLGSSNKIKQEVKVILKGDSAFDRSKVKGNIPKVLFVDPQNKDFKEDLKDKKGAYVQRGDKRMILINNTFSKGEQQETLKHELYHLCGMSHGNIDGYDQKSEDEKKKAEQHSVDSLLHDKIGNTKDLGINRIEYKEGGVTGGWNKFKGFMADAKTWITEKVPSDFLTFLSKIKFLGIGGMVTSMCKTFKIKLEEEAPLVGTSESAEIQTGITGAWNGMKKDFHDIDLEGVTFGITTKLATLAEYKTKVDATIKEGLFEADGLKKWTELLSKQNPVEKLKPIHLEILGQLKDEKPDNFTVSSLDFVKMFIAYKGFVKTSEEPNIDSFVKAVRDLEPTDKRSLLSKSAKWPIEKNNQHQ